MVTHSMSSSGPADRAPGLALGAEFGAATRAEWREQVAAALRRTGQLSSAADAPEAPEELLATRTYDGYALQPLYTEAPEQPGTPGLSPHTRGARAQGCVTGGWDVRQHHGRPDPAGANEEILTDLNGGATSLWLRAGSAGLPVDGLADALAEVELGMAGVVLDADHEAPAAAEALLQLAADRGVRPSALTGNLGLDPLGTQARTGRAADADAAVALARRCAETQPGMRSFVVDALPYHEAGGSDADEIGAALAAAVTYLRWLTEAGVPVETAAGMLEFRFAATADQFATITKFRTARRLWDQVTRACGVRGAAQQQHAVTSPAMLTRYDPWVNLLRNTIATVAAGVGGAQAVTTLPFDAAIGLPDAFARRLARNTQAVLLDESHLAQVIDPAGGSWYVESRTTELARQAWNRFQEFEAAGGWPAAWGSGLLAERLEATWQARAQALAHRTDAVIGVSEYPDLTEEPVQRTPAPPQPVGGLARHRYAEGFERLRDAAEAARESTGQRPTVFLATLGALATYTARASFTRNLLAAGGVAATEAGATETTAEVLEAYRSSPSPVVCLCSSDATYDERAAETARELARAGAAHVLLAGKPAELPEGVDGCIFSGCDALSVLRTVQRELGVAS
ncbi:methylmalonyl-CoA mutase family protein [Bounagaea algeriensis]